MRRQTIQETAQHTAVRMSITPSIAEFGRAGIHGGLQTISQCFPHQEQIGLDHAERGKRRQVVEIFPRACQCACILVGCDNFCHAALRQQQQSRRCRCRYRKPALSSAMAHRQSDADTRRVPVKRRRNKDECALPASRSRHRSCATHARRSGRVIRAAKTISQLHTCAVGFHCRRAGYRAHAATEIV